MIDGTINVPMLWMIWINRRCFKSVIASFAKLASPHNCIVPTDTNVERIEQQKTMDNMMIMLLMGIWFKGCWFDISYYCLTEYRNLSFCCFIGWVGFFAKYEFVVGKQRNYCSNSDTGVQHPYPRRGVLLPKKGRQQIFIHSRQLGRLLPIFRLGKVGG